MIETFDQIEENLRLDYPQRLQVREVVEKRAEEARDKKYIISAIILPSFTKVTLRDAGGLAQLRLAQTAIALERFRAARDGHFPDSLNELVPDYFTAAPKDPFDGHNLRYHRVANGYVLYSIGMDLKDDGGMRLKGGKGDLVFSVVNPPKTP